MVQNKLLAKAEKELMVCSTQICWKYSTKAKVNKSARNL